MDQRCKPIPRKCRNPYWLLPRVEEKANKYSVYQQDYGIPFKNGGLFNFYMAHYDVDAKRNLDATILKCSDPTSEIWKYKEITKSGLLSVYSQDFGIKVSDPAKFLMPGYGPGKRRQIRDKLEFGCPLISKPEDTTLRGELVDLYANRFGSYQRELMERNNTDVLSNNYGIYTGLRRKKYFLPDLEY